MELREELLPAKFDTKALKKLVELAEKIVATDQSKSDSLVAEFSKISGATVTYMDFHHVLGGDTFKNWIQRLLQTRSSESVSDVSREELAEVVRRAMPQNGYEDYEGYMQVLDANAKRKGASNLIFYPPDFDPTTNTWGNGLPIAKYDPTPEQIVEWALTDEEVGG